MDPLIFNKRGIIKLKILAELPLKTPPGILDSMLATPLNFIFSSL